MSELADTLAALEAALRALGEDGRADWVAERRARAEREPDAVRGEVRGVLAGMGGIADLPLDRELVARVRHAVGDASDGPRRIIPAQPGGPIRP
jgi:hypothetical protein